MAASFNKVMLLGNLTRDPELRYIPSGQAVTTFTIAVNRPYLSSAGEKKEEVTFVRVVVWGRHAEVCNEYLKKGSSVFVEGRLQSRNWEAADGAKRSTIEVVSQSVQFLGRPMKQAAAGDAEKPHQPSSEEAIIDDSFGTPVADQPANSSSSNNVEEVPF